MNKKKMNPFIKILIVLIIIFIVIFIANTSGYYDAEVRNKMVLTEKGIKEFEKKVEKGEEIDIYSYLETEKVDYSNTFSNLGNDFTSALETVVTDGVDIISKLLKSLF